MTPNKPTNKSKATTKTAAPSTKESASTLPQVILGRPHSMPRRLYNVPASRKDTSGKE